MKTTTNYIDDEIKHKTQLVQDIRVQHATKEDSIIMIQSEEATTS